MLLLQSTYPQRLKLASAKAVEELLDLLHMYEPPNDPEGRKQFESQVYATHTAKSKAKGISKGQKDGHALDL